MCPTCQGYSFTSVSCPPTILVRLLAWPQVQVLVLPLEMVVAGGGVVVVTGEGVVVEANIIYNHFISLTYLPTPLLTHQFHLMSPSHLQ